MLVAFVYTVQCIMGPQPCVTLLQGEQIPAVHQQIRICLSIMPTQYDDSQGHAVPDLQTI